MMSNLSRNRAKSTWTPLVNQDCNIKIFEERADLVYKWFEKWSDGQRKQVLAGLLKRCQYSQLLHARRLLHTRCPTEEKDLSRVLPRCLALYVFSFLDPRTLCRCARVCWYWRHLAESDQVWMPKCARIGWYLPFSPTPYEVGVWKQLYAENVKGLRIYRLGAGKNEVKKFGRSPLPQRPASAGIGPQRKKVPPWRPSDPRPADIHRFNYLNNDDSIVNYAPHNRPERKFRKTTNAMRVIHALSKSTGNLSLKSSLRAPRSSAHQMSATHEPVLSSASYVMKPAAIFAPRQAVAVNSRGQDTSDMYRPAWATRPVVNGDEKLRPASRRPDSLHTNSVATNFVSKQRDKQKIMLSSSAASSHVSGAKRPSIVGVSEQQREKNERDGNEDDDPFPIQPWQIPSGPSASSSSEE